MTARADRQGALAAAVENAIRQRGGALVEGGKEWQFLCPAHNDQHRPGAYWNRTKGGWKCQTCGAGGNTAHLANLLGIEAPAPERIDTTVVARYDYVDEEGRLLYQIERLLPKSFRYRRKDGRKWLYTSKGGPKNVLYRLDRLPPAGSDEWVIYCEGEKDADRAIKEGCRYATTNAFGATRDGRPKWEPQYGDQLAGRRVALVFDADTAGNNSSRQVANLLRTRASRVVRIDLPGLPDRRELKTYKDLSDWFDLGNTAEDLYALIEETAARPEPDPGQFEPPEEVALESQVVLSHPETDAGNGELFALKWGNLCRYDHKRGRWLLWKGHRWGEDADGQLSRWAVETARARQKAIIDAGLGAEEFGARMRFARQCENSGRLKSMLELARSVPPIADPGESWDDNPYLLGCENGIVNLATGEFRDGRLEDRVTLSTGLRYDPAAKCQRWEAFIDEIFEGALSMVEYAQRAVGYSLTGDTREQCWFLMHGKGANGKSTFLETIAEVLGDYSGNLPFTALQHGKEQSIPTDLAALPGRRFVTSSETTEHSRLNEARIKSLTGGDAITARQLYERQFTFRPALKLWIALNHLPTVTDVSEGFWRRVRLIPFSRQFGAAERDPRLRETLMQELPGILAWAVRGARKWLEHGLQMPASVATATTGYQHDSDPLGEFIADCCVELPHVKVKASTLYAAYTTWAQAQGYREKETMGVGIFGKRVGDRWSRVRQKDGNYYNCIALRADEIVQSPPFADPGVYTPVQPIAFSTNSEPATSYAPASSAKRVQAIHLYTNSDPCSRHEGQTEPCPEAQWWLDDEEKYHCTECHPIPMTEEN